MSELGNQIERYLEELMRSAASRHTIDAYAADLRQFLGFLSPPGSEPPPPRAIDVLVVREWLAGLYRDQLTVVTIRRKLAAVRAVRLSAARRRGRSQRRPDRTHSQGTAKAPRGDDGRTGECAHRRRCVGAHRA